MKIIWKHFIVIIISLFLRRCNNESLELTPKSKITKTNDTTMNVISNEKNISGIWYYPTLKNSFVEIVNHDWRVDVPAFNAFTSSKFHWIDSTKLFLRFISQISKIELGIRIQLQFWL